MCVSRGECPGAHSVHVYKLASDTFAHKQHKHLRQTCTFLGANEEGALALATKPASPALRCCGAVWASMEGSLGTFGEPCAWMG